MKERQKKKKYITGWRSPTEQVISTGNWVPSSHFGGMQVVLPRYKEVRAFPPNSRKLLLGRDLMNSLPFQPSPAARENLG